jgi:hypothetical protein
MQNRRRLFIMMQPQEVGMTVKTDEFMGVSIRHYGEFLGTYESDHGEVSAQLFRNNDTLKALLVYHRDLEKEKVTDNYVADLQRIAAERSLTLKLLHAAP